jgi:prefoldin subunit 5
MATALEECSTCEVLDRNEAIEALKKEIEVLVAEKTHLTAEVGGLSSTRAEVENLRKEADLLKKQVEDAKGVKALATKPNLKSNETTDNLRKELNAEKESGLALQ